MLAFTSLSNRSDIFSRASPQVLGRIFVLSRRLFSTSSSQTFSVEILTRSRLGGSHTCQSSRWGWCSPNLLCPPRRAGWAPVQSQDTCLQLSEAGHISRSVITPFSRGRDAARSGDQMCKRNWWRWRKTCQPPLIWYPFYLYGKPRWVHG